MSMFPTKILLAVDGSEEAERAAFMGVELSHKTNSELHVVYVAPFPSIGYVPEGQDEMGGALAEREGYRLVYAAPFPGILQVPKQEHRRELAEREGRKRLDEQLEKIKDMGGEIAEAHLEIGRPETEILRVSEEIDAGLLAVGSRGHGLVRRALMGSISSSVVRHAHCPVLVVR